MLVHIYLHIEPTESDVHVLDQITVANISDQEALDDFLNSTDDETTASSPQSGTPSLVADITKLIHCKKFVLCSLELTIKIASIVKGVSNKSCTVPSCKTCINSIKN